MFARAIVAFVCVMSLTAVSGRTTVVLDEDFDIGVMPPGFVVLRGIVTVDPWGEGYALHFGVWDQSCLGFPDEYPREGDLVIVLDGTIIWGPWGDLNLVYYDQMDTEWCDLLLNGYRADLYPIGSDNPDYRLVHFEGEAGKPTLLDSHPSEITPGKPFHVEYQFLADGSIRVFVDYIQKLESVDSAFSSGFITLRSWDEIWVDNIRVCVGPTAVQECGPLFADSFESGDTSAWSATVP